MLQWFDADEDEVATRVFDYVSSVESAQSDIYDRFLKLACLYDPNERMGLASGWWSQANSGPDGQVSENVCASNIDTVAAVISKSETRARFMTDDGDWSTQRRARQLELYAEGLVKKLDIYPKAQRGFKDCGIFGTGIVKVYEDGKRINVERVLIDEMVADEGESKSGCLRQLHQRKLVNRSALKARFPKYVDVIDSAQTDDGSGSGRSWSLWADYRPIERDQLVVVESWYLPYGEPGDADYQPGKHAICIDKAALLLEDYSKTYFPFAKIVWSERTTGWYGIGLLERIAGHQRTINKLNWQIDRQLDQHAVPTTWVQMADAGIAVKQVNRLGTFGVYKAAKPETIIPPAVSGEQFKRVADVKASSFEESGMSRLLAASTMPSGIESAVAQREYKATTTERFAIQEQAYERFLLDIIWLALACAKDLGASAPKILAKKSTGSSKLSWADVDMGDVRVQIAAANNISRTPGGRTQTVIEWAQAGVISQDEARRLLKHPDLERAMSLYNAALEDIERCIEEILDGEMLVPEPYQNLKMGVWRFQMAYLKACADGAPEEVKEALRTWMNQAAYVLNPPAPPTPPAMPMNPMAQDPMAAMAPPDPNAAPMPVDPMAPPMGAPPQAAFSEQAMKIQPSYG